MTREEAIAILQGRQKEIAEDIFILIEHRKRIHEALDMAIESLSANCTTEKPNDIVDSKNDAVAEPTDLISRADAIKAIELRQTEQWIDADVDYNNGLESAVAEIKALPSADRPSGEWKPVSEGLPQRVGSYIVTCIGEHGSVYVDYDYWTVLAEFKYNRDKVTAWMPFPMPYCCSYGERKDNIT